MSIISRPIEVPGKPIMQDKPDPGHASEFATVQGLAQNGSDESNATNIGPYKLLRELGRGGMGSVYLARHVNLQRTLAIKVLPPEFANSPDRIERFRREMAAIGRLEHPNIVLATDAGEAAGTAYIAMQFLDGIDMSAPLKNGRSLKIADACEIVRQAAIGLQHVFQSGLVHRDIKPSNLFLTRHGEVKILDLGLAMLRNNDTLSTEITAPNMIMGTPDFIAPEQINASHKVDIRSDIYSLGCTLYALCAGQAPFEGQQFSTTTSKLVAHAEKQAVSLKTVRPEVPDAVVQIVERMMAKSPESRFAQPQMVADALLPWSRGSNLMLLANPDSNATATPTKNSSKSIRSRSLIGLAGLALLGAALLSIVIFMLWPERPPQQLSQKTPPGPDAATAALALDGPSQVAQTADPPAALPTPSAASSIDSSLEKISQSAQAIESSNKAVEQNTRKIAQSFDELIKQLNGAQTGKPISEPRTPGEHYYNALVYGMQGNARLARQSFLAYFDANQDYIDPHLKFIETLTLQEGKASVREIYKSLAGDRTLLSRRFAEASLLDSEARREALAGLTSAHDDFAPAWYAQSTFYSGSSTVPQTLYETAEERNCLERFMAAHERGGLMKYFLDPSEAAGLLTRAETRLKALNQIDQERVRLPVSLAMAMKIGENWQATIEIAEPAKELLYRVGETGDFQALGRSVGADPVTGLPLPKKSFMIPGHVQKTSLFLKYVDMKDRLCGPFNLPFDAQEQLKKWETYSIQQLKPNWLRLVDDRLFFDVFHSGRSVLKEVRYGLDVDKPNKSKAIPKAELSGQNSQEYFEAVPASSKYAVVQLLFADGTTSEVVRIERR